MASEAQDPAQETATEEFSTLINTCMTQLERRHREVLTMRNVLNLSYEDIAQSLGINVGTVKSRIARARENLRALLAASCPEFAPETAPAEYFIQTRAGYGWPAIAYA